jgi:beta-lactamase regulating signal transducer with metallopeptidase domain
LPFALIWLRALVRAIRAMRRPRVMPLAATVGLLRPQVVIDRRLQGTLDAPALAAVVAHEEAHAAHRDPLRIWLARLLTDVQWSSPWSRHRLDHWLAALEMARDEEARLRGTRGEDLAAAVVAVAGMRPVSRGHAVASLTGTEAALMDRVRRLLSPVPAPITIRSRALSIALAISLVAAVLIGIECGDALLRALPFVTT